MWVTNHLKVRVKCFCLPFSLITFYELLLVIGKRKTNKFAETEITWSWLQLVFHHKLKLSKCVSLRVSRGLGAHSRSGKALTSGSIYSTTKRERKKRGRWRKGERGTEGGIGGQRKGGREGGIEEGNGETEGRAKGGRQLKALTSEILIGLLL